MKRDKDGFIMNELLFSVGDKVRALHDIFSHTEAPVIAGDLLTVCVSEFGEVGSSFEPYGYIQFEELKGKLDYGDSPLVIIQDYVELVERPVQEIILYEDHEE